MPASTPAPVSLPAALTRSARKFLCVVLLLLFSLRVLMIFFVPFTDSTESRYAEIARKMVETNDWITPQFDYGVPFWGKPPLHTWLSAAGMKIFGVNEFGGRIFIFLTACAMFALLYAWVKKVRGRDQALMGLTILAGFGLVFSISAAVMTDTAMVAGTSLSMVAFWNAMQGGRGAKRWGYFFFIGLAVGLLAKGPVAVVLTALPIGAWVLAGNRWRRTWQEIPWISGSLLMLLLAVPWYVAAEMKTPGFLDYFIVGEHWQRFLDSDWKGDLYGAGHGRPYGTIWRYWLVAMLPWTPCLLLPLLSFRKIAAGFRNDRSGWLFYLLCWALAPLFFFTPASNIIRTYVYPGLPACAFLIVELWILTGGKNPAASLWRRCFFAGTVFLAVVIFATGFARDLFGWGHAGWESQKSLVARSSRDDAGGKYFYFGRRLYSAEFYSRGKAIRLPLASGPKTVLENGTRDWLAVKNKRFPSLPDDFSGRFSLLDRSGGYSLYREKENPPELADGKN